MLQIKDVTSMYPDQTVGIQQLDLEINAGESVALIGANGAGKSTLLLTLVGILLPIKGHITIDGLSLTEQSLNAIRQKVGLVFQNPDDQLFMPKIEDDVAFGPKRQGLESEVVEERVTHALERMQIAHLRKRSPLKLSGGEKRSAAIATVLSMEPLLLLFDEPSAFLDPKSRRNLINQLNAIYQTKIIATHDLDLACSVCQRVILLNRGTFFAEGDPKTILYDHKTMEACGLEALR